MTETGHDSIISELCVGGRIDSGEILKPESTTEEREEAARGSSRLPLGSHDKFGQSRAQKITIMMAKQTMPTHS